jgi:biotin transporter BioY
MNAKRSRKRIYSHLLLIGSTAGFVLTFPAWLFGWIDDRTMLGLKLALSWFALIFEARTATHVDSD